jgi:glycogen synthase
MRKAVFIDSEPKHPVGGGIRTYLKAATGLLHQAGIPCTLYTSNPGAYSLPDIRPIGRMPWPDHSLRPFRSLAYAWIYEDVLAMEASQYLSDAIHKDWEADQRFEFCDYNGYGFHSLRIGKIAARSAIRLHTPLTLVRKASRSPSRMKDSILAWRERSTWEKAGRIFFPSPKFATEFFPNLPGETVWNPPPLAPHPSTLGPFPAIEPHFLYAARWEPRKGLWYLVQAFHRLVAEVPQATLTLIGHPPNTEYGMRIAKSPEFREGMEKGWIRIRPETSGPKSELFHGASILVLPSEWENAPYLFQEAMAYGVIALGSKTGEMGEIQSQTHRIQPLPGRSDSLADALLELWQRREESDRWRELQWAWLGQRTVAARERLVDAWMHWPVPS